MNASQIYDEAFDSTQTASVNFVDWNTRVIDFIKF